MKKLLAIFLFSAVSIFAQPYITGTGAIDDPFMYYSAENLDSMRWFVDPGAGLYYHELANDIDLSGYSNWIPITRDGHATNPWTGSFNGAGYTISNLTIDSTYTTGTIRSGFFGSHGGGDAGQTDDAIKGIHNVTFLNPSITVSGTPNAQVNIGIVCGLSAGNFGNTDVEFDSISVRGGVIRVDLTWTPGANDYNVGGFSGNTGRCGHIYVDADIEVLTSGVNTTALDSDGIGGIAGATGNGMRECGFTGRIYSNAVGVWVGGLIGEVDDAFSATDTIADCYVNATSLVADYYVGGLIGSNLKLASSVMDQARLFVTVDSLACLVPTTQDLDGMLIAYSEDAVGVVWYSVYADTERVAFSPLFVPVGGDTTGYEVTLTSWQEGSQPEDSAMTTAEMKTQSTFVDFDFTNVWGIDGVRNGGYPYLLWVAAFTASALNHPDSAGIVVVEYDTMLVHWTATDDTTITEQYLHYSINGGSDWTLIDTVDVADTSYSWIIPDASTTTGKVRISTDVANLQDSSSNNFTIFKSSALDIIYPIEKAGQTFYPGDTVHVNIESYFIEDIWLYWSNDSTAWTFLDSTAVDTVNLQYADTTTYVWTFTGAESGPEIWVKAEEQADTALYYFVRSYVEHGGGFPVGTFFCQYDSGGALVYHKYVYDPSCGWVANITWTYYTRILNDDGLGHYFAGTGCAFPHTGCTFPIPVGVYLTGADTTYTDLNVFYDFGTTVTYLNRLYYIADQMLYCNDLINDIDSILVADLSDMYDPGLTYPWTEGDEYMQVYNVQRSKISGEYIPADTTFEDLNDAEFEPRIIIGESTGTYPAYTISVEALPYPNNADPAEDTQKILTGTVIGRYFFRGIHPKIDKNR